MDGTLIDQTAGIVQCFTDVTIEFGNESPDPSIIKRSLGGPMAETMALFVSKNDVAAACLRFRERFPEIMYDGLIFFDDASTLVDAFADLGIPQGILTNKHGPTARAVSDHLKLSSKIKVCVGNKDTEWKKPQAELTNHVLSALGSNYEGACLIGDSPTDVETATNAGLPCYCVATGAHSVDELIDAGAVAAFNTLSELHKKFVW